MAGAVALLARLNAVELIGDVLQARNFPGKGFRPDCLSDQSGKVAQNFRVFHGVRCSSRLEIS